MKGATVGYIQIFYLVSAELGRIGTDIEAALGCLNLILKDFGISEWGLGVDCHLPRWAISTCIKC